eukprot:m51a1_g11924 hypothetical protein (336) ;mRNA; r:675898-677200
MSSLPAQRTPLRVLDIDDDPVTLTPCDAYAGAAACLPPGILDDDDDFTPAQRPIAMPRRHQGTLPARNDPRSLSTAALPTFTIGAPAPGRAPNLRLHASASAVLDARAPLSMSMPSSSSPPPPATSLAFPARSQSTSNVPGSTPMSAGRSRSQPDVGKCQQSPQAAQAAQFVRSRLGMGGAPAPADVSASWKEYNELKSNVAQQYYQQLSSKSRGRSASSGRIKQPQPPLIATPPPQAMMAPVIVPVAVPVPVPVPIMSSPVRQSGGAGLLPTVPPVFTSPKLAEDAYDEQQQCGGPRPMSPKELLALQQQYTQQYLSAMGRLQQQQQMFAKQSH